MTDDNICDECCCYYKDIPPTNSLELATATSPRPTFPTASDSDISVEESHDGNAVSNATCASCASCTKLIMIDNIYDLCSSGHEGNPKPLSPHKLCRHRSNSQHYDEKRKRDIGIEVKYDKYALKYASAANSVASFASWASFASFASSSDSISDSEDGKETGKLLSPEYIAGTWKGNGHFCSPSCCRLEISPACGGGICVYYYCGCIPLPFFCRYMIKCGACYFDCDDDNIWTPDINTLDMKCGRGFVRNKHMIR